MLLTATTTTGIADGTRLNSPPSTGGPVDLAVGRSSDESSGINLDSSVHTSGDARPEPSGSSADLPPPPGNDHGNDGHADPSRIPPEPSDNTNQRDTTTPQLGVKTTRATMKIATLNIRGGGSTATRDKWQHVNQIMRENNIAILAIQETHLNETSVNELNNQFNQRLRIINSQDPVNPSAGRGVAIILNKRLTSWKQVIITHVIPGRALLVSLPWKGESTINVLAIYAPNSTLENAAFWEDLKNTWINDNHPIPDIMLGDFNLVEEAIDRLPAHRDSAQAVDKFVDFKDMHALRDSWRHQNPSDVCYTYTQEATQSRSRIDRIYTTQPIYAHSRNWSVDHTPIRTDHCLVSMEFANPGAPFIGKGRWSIPLYLIKHRKVIQFIEELGTQLEKDMENAAGDSRTPEENPQKLFATFKTDLVKKVRDFSRKETPKMDIRILNLKKDLHSTLNNSEDSTTDIQAKAAYIEERIKQLELIRHTKIRDNLATRGRLESETLSKSWINANKEGRPRDTIQALRLPPLPTAPLRYTRRSSEMANLASTYHQNLQDDNLAHDITEHEYEDILSHLSPRISPQHKNKLATYITQNEIQQALKDLPDGKAAGIDGIPHELWKTLAARYENKRTLNQPKFNIVKCLTILYNDIERHGIAPPSEFPKGWMCPLYKKGDTTEISNYRPITVLNTDYKIMTRALTTRLTEAVPSLIHPDQAGFMRGRRIEDQTELVKLVLNNCEANESNGAIVCLDQEKAYDKVRHDFIWKTLDKFDFPKHFTNTIRALYDNGETVVIINGVISDPYKVTRGVRQGDPLSCLIFNLAIESLASMLRSSDLQGLRIEGDVERLITTLFADDTTVYLSENDNFGKLQEILQKWCRASGANFNVKKTVILPAGTPEYRNTVCETRKLNQEHTPIPGEIKIAKDGTPVRVLGAYVGNNVDQTAVWTPTLEKISARLQQWAKSHPTQDGKRLIIGMVIGGLTQYLTRVQGMSTEVETTISRKISKFLWDETSPMVNASIMSSPIESGGKKILNIKARNEAIELMKLKSYLQLNKSRPRWAKVADALIMNNIPKAQNVRDTEAKQNTFLQTWTVKTGTRSQLPRSLSKMLQTAKKYNVDLNPPLPSMALRKQMPVWFHKGQNPETNPRNNGIWADCQRLTHNIRTVGQMEEYANETRALRHNMRINCACNPCKTARNKGCPNPAKCRQAAKKILESLHLKWSPLAQEDLGRLKLSEEQLLENSSAWEKGDDIIFDPSIISTSELTEEFRVFVDHQRVRQSPAVRELVDEPQEDVTVLIHTLQVNQGYEDAKSAYTVWFGEDDPRNLTERTRGKIITKEASECQAALYALTRIPSQARMTMVTSSGYLRQTLTKNLKKMEDRNWMRSPNAEILQALVATLRARAGLTKIGQLKDKSIVANLKERTMEGLSKQRNDEEPALTAPESFQVTGIKLSCATQSTLYQSIMRVKKEEPRAASVYNLGITQACIEELTGKSPTHERIWKSIKNKTFPPRIRAFLWKAIHSAYKCGKYWRNIPTCEERGLCQVCDRVEESMEHILTECQATGQAEIWRLAEELWALRGLPWTQPRFGTILGCGLAAFHSEGGDQKLTGANRLYAILMSESAHLIWRLRCKWKISEGASQEKILSNEAVKDIWLQAINRRLQLEMLSTDKARYGRRALKSTLVAKTWWGVLRNQELLDDDWLKGTGVLVGIGDRPPGRNR